MTPFDPWPAIREYLGDREMTAQTLAEVLEAHFIKALHSPESSECGVRIPLWVYELMLEALQTPGPKRQRHKTWVQNLGDGLKSGHDEVLSEFRSHYPSQNDFTDAEIEFSFDETVILIQALQGSSHGRRGRPSLSISDQLMYDSAILVAKALRSVFTDGGVPFELAQGYAAAHVREEYPMRSVGRILRDLEKADVGKPFRT